MRAHSWMQMNVKVEAMRPGREKGMLQLVYNRVVPMFSSSQPNSNSSLPITDEWSSQQVQDLPGRQLESADGSDISPLGHIPIYLAFKEMLQARPNQNDAADGAGVSDAADRAEEESAIS